MARSIAIRILICMVIGIVFGFIFSEVSYLAVKHGEDRDPKEIELVIPAGTAEKIAAGQSESSLPADMIFVQGDTLVVKNEDAANHQLGPMFVPAGATGRLLLGEVQNFSYACTFETSQYLGLDVRPRLGWGTRVQGIITIGLPTIVLLFVYSIVMYPFNKPVNTLASEVKHNA
jgi:hypothetical protein